MNFAKISLILVVIIITDASMVVAQTYSGASSCQSCHSNSAVGGTQYTDWILTGHSRAYDSVAFVQNKTACAPCHTTGWDTTVANNGADDYVTRNGDGTFTVDNSSSFNARTNVQCESCHGPVQFGVNHAYPPTPGSLVNAKAEVCGSCHNGDHQPQYPEWLETKHADSDTNESPYLANLFRSDANCSACHTYQGFLQVIDSTSWVPHVPNPPGAAALPIVCATCHNPHSNANASQLRLPKADLCVKCHNPQYDPTQPVPGTAVHNSGSYMLDAKGGYEYAGYTYESSAHKFVITDKCITCHMHSTPYVSAEQPAVTGHEFEPSGKACADACHTDFDTLSSSFDYRRVQTVTDSLSNLLSAKLAAATSADSATDAFKQAKFNYDFVEADMSHGVHNTKYAQGLLKSALLNFSPSTSVENIDQGTPDKFNLNQNYPNPFNPSTQITFAIPVKAHVRMQIFDITGHLVTTLIDQEMPAGNYKATWYGTSQNGSSVTTGVYLCKMTAGSFTQTTKMLFLK